MGDLLDTIRTQPVIDDNVNDIMSDYRKQRDALSAKFGGMLPIADGEIHKVEMAQGGDHLEDGRVAVRITMLCSTMDQIALMAAPSHHMKAVLFEDRRGVRDAKETDPEAVTKRIPQTADEADRTSAGDSPVLTGGGGPGQ